jgi:hypothetical protein
MDTIVNARIDEAVDRLRGEFKGIFSPKRSQNVYSNRCMLSKLPGSLNSSHSLPTASPGSGCWRWPRQRGW